MMDASDRAIPPVNLYSETVPTKSKKRLASVKVEIKNSTSKRNEAKNITRSERVMFLDPI